MSLVALLYFDCVRDAFTLNVYLHQINSIGLFLQVFLQQLTVSHQVARTASFHTLTHKPSIR